jgi:tripartite-type tricarboxylate transporter receptor subunit TctC
MKKLLLLLLLSISLNASATDYPTKPVKIIVSLPVGSGADVVSRKIAEMLSKKWSVPVVVDNRPGASGGVALEAYIKEPANGYTLMFGDSPAFISYPILWHKEETLSNIEPLVPVFKSDLVLAVSPQIANFADLKTEMIKNSNFGSWAVGSPSHFMGLELSKVFGIPTTHIPYKEYGPWFVDLSTKNLAFSFVTIASTKHLEKAGKLKYLAIGAPTRDSRFPNLPTVSELTGTRVNSINVWDSFYILKSVDPLIKKQLSQDIREVIATPEVQQTLATIEYVSIGNMSLTEFNKLVTQDTTSYKKLIKEFNISID